jgi:hypothetical protein
MGSMHTGLEETGGIMGMLGFTEELTEMAEFYAERARGGVGLIVTGGISPNIAGCMCSIYLYHIYLNYLYIITIYLSIRLYLILP